MHTDTDIFKVIVAGSRRFNNYDLLKDKLDFYLQGKGNIMVISGGAGGADALGERYALENGCSIVVMNAEWERYGKAAGPKRNERMSEKADACIVFWDGKSRGSADMIRQAKEKGLPLRIVRYAD